MRSRYEERKASLAAGVAKVNDIGTLLKLQRAIQIMIGRTAEEARHKNAALNIVADRIETLRAAGVTE
jgi:hypothetical protein